MAENVHDLGLSNDFLGMTLKAQAINEKKIDFTKIKNFCTLEDTRVTM